MTQGQSDKTDIRLDKWLWAARFYKTRAIAKEMINGGKVHYNGQRAKSSRNAEIGAVLKIRQGYDDKEIVIKKLSQLRQSGAIAQELYEETATSLAKRAINAEQRRLNMLNNPIPDQKPDKKQRRQLMRFKDL
ncbi:MULTISPECIES: ribosome-associated heat shock protein Hsp15 [Shewanella]|jgi:ribosome-associated heat shock protein Hsp15|uniref:Heat shock protein 15 n=1 Tax=Shewanella baltica (strain OS195) TaxID=399599 RepID=A9KVC9_SHEB9|nr:MULTISPECIES: ribosome-associated heat shock protein Hsp15 [Shewanella]MBO6228693.1 ribosome-associated heat shock protein Hsp15 [Shewanella sp.]ABS06318.1 RNA-binding S4 domain protein [Shewanella baltica OS185]ABX47333.1 RNA-binding S4 domain protein [Shewanella baltica OS195]ACK44691.1 RNA-binding S4 domain protein [Shewanella baltica OS223]ADT92357.1 RNA-binding S4 domain protein [Shewanella baltica OS678]